MPISKKRTTKKRVVREAVAQEESKRWSVKLNGSRLAALRKDPDFLTIIKMGRVMNAVDMPEKVKKYRPSLFETGGTFC